MKPTNIGIYYKTFLLLGLFAILCVAGMGCQPEGILSSNSEIEAFDLAGPITPKVDLDQLLRAKSAFGIYTVGQGDVLEIQMPTILTVVSPKTYNEQQQPQVAPYLCRVSDAGTITVPIIGQVKVEGKTLAKIEEELVSGYYPKYIVDRPSVVCGVKEFHFNNITVVGAVMTPGVFQLKSNEMSLVTALMKAGGIVEGGASVITIKNPQRQNVGPMSTDGIKQLAELGSPVNERYIESTERQNKNLSEKNFDFSSLDAELVFQPEKSGATRGNLIIQKDSKTLYAKKIDIKNPAQRAEYVKELQTVIGSQQAYIVSGALEQLAKQLSPAISASGEKPIDNDDKELIEAVTETRQINQADKSNEVGKKDNCPGCNNKYIETKPASKVEVGTTSDSVKFVEPVPVKANQPNQAVTPTAGAVKPIILPVKGLNIPFADVALMDGDLVEVRRLNPDVFTVIGLVKKPGSFPYPPDAEYNLMQAIGFAEGLDNVADPRFLSVYRQNTKGEIVSATFRVDKKYMASSYNVKIKPGDVISVDMTPRTKRNLILNQIFRINVGMYANPFSN